MSPAADLQEAISLIKEGKKVAGREKLIKLLEEDQNNDLAWFWMTAVMETDQQRLDCLEEAVRINPENKGAQKALAQMREKLGIFEEEPVAEAFPFPELMIHNSQVQQAAPTQNTWSFSEHDPLRELEEDIGPAKPSADRISHFTSTPYFTIIFAPRLTVSAIIKIDPRKNALLLSVLIGIFTIATGLVGLPNNEFIPPDLITPAILVGASLVGGALYGIIYFYIAGIIFHWLGFVLGGQGKASELRIALIWSNVPRLYLYPLQLLFLYLLNQEFADVSVAEARTLSDIFSPLSILLITISIALGIWLFYVYLECLGAAHRFSAWRAFAMLLLPTLLLILLGCALSLLLGIEFFFLQ